MNTVDIRGLKAKADLFPEPIRSDILHEEDTLDSERYLVKMQTWERQLELLKK
jgi:hypothetical protein